MLRTIIVFTVLSGNMYLCHAQGIQLHDAAYRFRKPVQSRVFSTPVRPARQQVPAAAYAFSSAYINPGFFCRQEVKLDKKLPLPLRIRLGSLQYCNWLEQKPGYTGAWQQ